MASKAVGSIPTENLDLIHENALYAKKIARRFFAARKRFGVELDDFEGAALLGLCDAARLFNRNKGSNFRSFAFPRIRGAMLDMLRQGAGISRRDFHAFVIARDSVSNADAGKYCFQQTPCMLAKTRRELASLSDVLIEAGMRVCYDAQGDSVDVCYANSYDPESAIAEKFSRQYLSLLVECLPEKQRAVIRRDYWEEPQEVLADMSRSWVFRLHGRAIEQLREELEVRMR